MIVVAGQHRAAGPSRCGSDANQGCNQEPADVRPPLTVTPSSVGSYSNFTSILEGSNLSCCSLFLVQDPLQLGLELLAGLLQVVYFLRVRLLLGLPPLYCLLLDHLALHLQVAHLTQTS